MNANRKARIRGWPSIIVLMAALTALPAHLRAQNNPYGVHAFLQDQMSESNISKHLTWARRLTGANGYVKELIYPITTATQGPQPSWVRFVSTCWEKRLIPVLRVATYMENGAWVKPPADAPGDYTSFANAVRRVVQGLPLDATLPLYVEVLNEPNNNVEWSWQVNPAEYAHVLQDVAAALHSIGPQIRVTNGGLSPGGSYDNLQFIRAMFAAVPSLGASIDAWATHPYCGDVPPEQNNHDGTASNPRMAIDSYMTELAVLAEYMDISELKIIATEGGFSGLDRDTEAAYMMRAFRDYWSRWPEVAGICPWYFCNPLSDGEGPDWVYPYSETLPDGYPTIRKRIYETVAALAKPGDATGAVSGTITESAFGTPVGGATVTLSPGARASVSNSAGTYFFADLAPGTYSLSVTRPGYVTQTRTDVVVTAAANRVDNFILVAAGTATLRGTVSDPLTGRPLAGATITTNPGGYTALSGTDGTYTIGNLPPGTYEVTATRRGRYAHRRSGIVAEAGLVLAVDFSPGQDDFPAAPPLIGGLAMDTAGVYAGVASGWTNVDGGHHPEIFAIDTGVRYSGHGSQRIRAGPPGSNNYVWNITDYSAVEGGQTYLVEAWCRTEGLLKGPHRGAAICVNFFSNDMVFKGQSWSNVALEGTTDWTRLHVIPLAPSGSGRMQVQLVAEGTAGTAWFDNPYAGRAAWSNSSSPSGFFGSGWNLVSLPLVPRWPQPRYIFNRCIPSGDTMAGEVLRYGLGGGYEAFPEAFAWMQTGTGYWAYLAYGTGCSSPVSGHKHEREQYIPLANGWTLIGHPFATARSLAACEVLCAGRAYGLPDAPGDWIQKTLYTYDRPAGGYRRVRPDAGGDDHRLYPWRGYWVRGFREDLTLVVPPDDAPNPPPAPAPIPDSRLRLRIESPGCLPWGFTAVLAASASAGLDEWDTLAPPVPPDGTREIRLISIIPGAGEAAEDARPTPTAGGIESWTVRIAPVYWPAGHIETVTLTWDLTGAGECEYRLVETSTGTVIFPASGGHYAFELEAGDSRTVEVRARPGGFSYGDFGGDGDVDVEDFSFFQACFSGPGAPPPDRPCEYADWDADGDIDVADFAAFQVCFNGPGRPPACR